MSTATTTSHASGVPTPPRIVALHKRREEPPCLAPVAPNVEPRPQSRRAFDRHQAEQSLRQLQAMCILAPELERITRKTRRHWQNGTYQHEVLVDVLHRFVVEPAAIDLTAARPEQHLPWFQAYPADLRERLAARLALVVEQEIGIANGAMDQPEVYA
jgi:hypothetical protein